MGFPLSDQNVSVQNAGSGHFDQDLPLRDRWIRDLLVQKFFRSARFIDADGFHGVSFLAGAAQLCIATATHHGEDRPSLAATVRSLQVSVLSPSDARRQFSWQ
jgi:hypothetical protein